MTRGAAAYRRGFWLLWGGEVASLVGSAATSVVLPLIAVQILHADAFWMGIIGAATWLPWVVVGLPVGAWVDSRPPKPMMIGANAVSALAYLSIPIAIMVGIGALWHLAAVAFVVGTCSVVFRSAYVKMLVRIVPAEDRAGANSILFGTENAANTIGPSIGGVLVQLIGAASAMFVQVGGLLVSIACLLGIREPAPEPATPRAKLSIAIADGLRVVFGDRYLRFFALQGAAANFGLTGGQVLLVLWFTRDLGLGSTEIGIVFGITSFGGIIGALGAPFLGRRFGDARGVSVMITLAGFATPMLAFAMPGVWLWTAVGISSLGVAGVVAANVLRRTWTQRYIPERLLARQNTSSQLVNLGAMPLASLAAGFLGAHFDIRWVVLGMYSIVLVASLASWTQPWLRVRDLPLTEKTTTAAYESSLSPA